MSKKTDDKVFDFQAEEIQPETVKLSNGVVVKIKPVSSFVYTEMYKAHKKPRPPVLFIEAIGREEENPDDPEYLSKLEEYQTNLSITATDTMILFGTQVISTPDDIDSFEDGEWLENLDALGYTIPANKKSRYLMWFKYVIANHEQDMELIMEHVSRRSGVSEAEVETAVESFRDSE
jgi:hypothetical protein